MTFVHLRIVQPPESGPLQFQHAVHQKSWVIYLELTLVFKIHLLYVILRAPNRWMIKVARCGQVSNTFIVKSLNLLHTYFSEFEQPLSLGKLALFRLRRLSEMCRQDWCWVEKVLRNFRPPGPTQLGTCARIGANGKNALAVSQNNGPAPLRLRIERKSSTPGLIVHRMITDESPFLS